MISCLNHLSPTMAFCTLSLLTLLTTQTLAQGPPAQQGLSFELNTGNRVGTGKLDFIQSQCMRRYFGDSVQFGLSGDGTLFVGSVIPTTGLRGPYGVFATGFAITAVANIRVMEPPCIANGADANDAPPSLTVRVPRTNNNLLFLHGSLGGQFLSPVDFTTGQSVSLSLSVAALLGVRYEHVWWDDETNVATRWTLRVGAGALVGFGSVPGAIADAAGNSMNSDVTGILLGGYVSFSISRGF